MCFLGKTCHVLRGKSHHVLRGKTHHVLLGKTHHVLLGKTHFFVYTAVLAYTLLMEVNESSSNRKLVKWCQIEFR